MASHHGHSGIEAHYPAFARARQVVSASRETTGRSSRKKRETACQTGRVARGQLTPDAITSAIRLQTDNGYAVLKAPTWPEHLPVGAVRRPPSPGKASALASESHPENAPGQVRELSEKLCNLFSTGRSTAYAHMKSGRLKEVSLAKVPSAPTIPPNRADAIVDSREPMWVVVDVRGPASCREVPFSLI